MQKFATIAILASSIAAVDLEQATGSSFKSYDATFDMLPDEVVMKAMPQGEGRDHTDWSWHLEHLEEEDKVKVSGDEVAASKAGLLGAQDEYDELMMKIIGSDEEHQRQCQLHREEEMNLYYQCTQNDINNYALHHFGGEVRSYPRWVKEYNVCIDHIHRAKTLHLDLFLDDGSIIKAPCDPQSHGSTIYIGFEKPLEPAVAEPVKPDVEPVVEPEVEPITPVEEIIQKPTKPIVLDPSKSCWDQPVPNWSGLWVEIWGGPEEAQMILDGKTPITEALTQRCYTVTPTGEHSGDLLETWDSPGARDYDLVLREDNRTYPGGCMIHTTLKGTNYTQWVASVRGDISMSDQIEEEWHQKQSDGVENFLSKHHEIRIGECTNSEDGKQIATKKFTEGIIVQ